jgi:hypothetical protein
LIITEKEYYLSCVCDEIYAAPGVQCSFSFEINPYKHSKDSSGRHQNIIELIEMQDFRKGK